MFLKTNNLLLAENPSEEEINSLIKNHKKLIVSESKKIYDGFNEIEDSYLEIKQINNSFNLVFYGDGKRLETTVDESYATKIIYKFALNQSDWRELSRWEEKDAPLSEIFEGFINILGPSSVKVIAYIIFGAFIIYGTYYTFNFIFKNTSSVVKNIKKSTQDKAREIFELPISNINPAKLCPIFTLGSDFTDLQRERITNEIKGKIIQWRLQVYEVASTEDKNVYRIQTQACIPESNVASFNNIEQEVLNALKQIGDVGNYLGNKLEVNRNVPTFINLVVMNENDKNRINSLKTNDWIVVKGKITGTFIRYVEIGPAVFADSVIGNKNN